MSYERKICFLVLIGIPGSGKTFLTNYLVNCFTSSDFKVVTISFDDYLSINNNEGDLINSKWKEQRKIIFDSVENFVSYLRGYTDFVNKLNLNYSTDCNNETVLLVLDDNMYYRSMRYEYFKLARKYQISYSQVFIDSGLDEALNRNSTRGNDERVPDYVIERMYNVLEKPDKCNEWEQYSISISANLKLDEFPKDLYKVIVDSIGNPEKPALENCSVVSPINVVHQLDKILRSIIGDHIKSLHKRSISVKEVAKDLNSRKIKILKCLKNETLILPSEIVNILQSDSSLENTSYINNYFVNLLFNKDI